jgi:hypothetical protein
MPSYVGQQGSGTAEDLGVGSIEDRPNSGNLTTVSGRTYGALNNGYSWIAKTEVSSAVGSFLDSYTSNTGFLRSIGDVPLTRNLNASAAVSTPYAPIFDPIPISQGNALVMLDGATALVISPSGVAARRLSTTNIYAQAYVNPSNPSQFVAVRGVSNGNLIYSTSTDGGNTWVEGSLSLGLFSANSLGEFGISRGTLNQINYFASPLGEIYAGNSANATWQLRCANRVITIGNNAGNTVLVASSSTTGFGSDVGNNATSAVLGNLNVSIGSDAQRYAWMKSEGSNAYFSIAGVNRYSTDGGLTWTNSAGAPTSGGGARYVNNASVPSKFLVLNINGNSVYNVTTNFGESFTTRSVAFAFTADDSVAWTGSIGALVDLSTQSAFITTNDFATVTPLPPITGVSGNPRSAWALDSRLFIFYTSGQIAITSDGVTFVVRSIKNYQTFNALYNRAAVLNGRIVVNANVFNSGNSSGAIVSTDNGVTWEYINVVASLGATQQQAALIRSINVGSGYFYFTAMSQNSINGSLSDQLVPANFTGPQSYALTASSISPIRSGTTAYMRLA